MTISSEQQHGVGVLRVGDGSHAPKGSGAVVESMGGNRDPGVLKRNALALEPGVGQELMHRRRAQWLCDSEDKRPGGKHQL